MYLYVKAQTSTTITLGWNPEPGAIGYRFKSSSMPSWSFTFDPLRTSVKFSKALYYEVEAIMPGKRVKHPPAPTPVGSLWHTDGWDAQNNDNWSYVQPQFAQMGSFVPGMRSGSYAFRANLPGSANTGIAGRESVQVTKVNPGEYRLTQRDHYSWRGSFHSIRDCYDFVTYAYPTIRYGAISLLVKNGVICLQMNTGYTENDVWPQYEWQVWADPLIAVELGEWPEFLFDIKRATDFTGSLSIEYRKNGSGLFTKVWEKLNIPTHQWGKAITGTFLDGTPYDYGNVDKNGVNITNAYPYTPDITGKPRAILDKVGAYAPLPPAGASAPNFTVLHDVFAAGTSREAVLAKL